MPVTENEVRFALKTVQKLQAKMSATELRQLADELSDLAYDCSVMADDIDDRDNAGDTE